jgi:hypothetical protein
MRPLAAGVLALLLTPAIASAAGLLGATLRTGGDWIEVESLATIPTEVVVAVTGQYRLAETSFTLQPGETKHIAATGTGRGLVSARMTAQDAGGDAGAVEVAAWIGYAPDRPHQSDGPTGAFLILLLCLVTVAASAAIHHRRYRHVHQ